MLHCCTAQQLWLPGTAARCCGASACSCAEVRLPATLQGQPLVPWCLPNTAERHNGWRGLFGRLDWQGHFPTSTTDPQPMGKVNWGGPSGVHGTPAWAPACGVGGVHRGQGVGTRVGRGDSHWCVMPRQVGQVFHPDQDRIISVRECARAQVPCPPIHWTASIQSALPRVPLGTSRCWSRQTVCIPHRSNNVLQRLTCAVPRLQGFPDSFRFYGNVHAQHRQIGNAVPPPLAAALGRQLRMVLEHKATKAVDAAIDAGLADI